MCVYQKLLLSQTVVWYICVLIVCMSPMQKKRSDIAETSTKPAGRAVFTTRLCHMAIPLGISRPDFGNLESHPFPRLLCNVTHEGKQLSGTTFTITQHNTTKAKVLKLT